MIPLFLFLLACPTREIAYDLPEGVVHISLRRGILSVDGKRVGPWNQDVVVNGIHPYVYKRLEKRTPAEVAAWWALDHPTEPTYGVFLELPTDTPGYILPTLLGTAIHADHGQIWITQSGSPILLGPSKPVWVTKQGPCENSPPNPTPRWFGEMQDYTPFNAVFQAGILTKDRGVEMPEVYVVRKCTDGASAIIPVMAPVP